MVLTENQILKLLNKTKTYYKTFNKISKTKLINEKIKTMKSYLNKLFAYLYNICKKHKQTKTSKSKKKYKSIIIRIFNIIRTSNEMKYDVFLYWRKNYNIKKSTRTKFVFDYIYNEIYVKDKGKAFMKIILYNKAPHKEYVKSKKTLKKKK